jgi:hypothetical protein
MLLQRILNIAFEVGILATPTPSANTGSVSMAGATDKFVQCCHGSKGPQPTAFCLI